MSFLPSQLPQSESSNDLDQADFPPLATAINVMSMEDRIDYLTGLALGLESRVDALSAKVESIHDNLKRRLLIDS